MSRIFPKVGSLPVVALVVRAPLDVALKNSEVGPIRCRPRPPAFPQASEVKGKRRSARKRWRGRVGRRHRALEQWLTRPVRQSEGGERRTLEVWWRWPDGDQSERKSTEEHPPGGPRRGGDASSQVERSQLGPGPGGGGAYMHTLRSLPQSSHPDAQKQGLN